MPNSPTQPSEDDPVPCLPHLSWAKLEMILGLLAANRASRGMVRNLTAATRLQSPFMPAEAIRRELIIILTALLDPSFPEEVKPMT